MPKRLEYPRLTRRDCERLLDVHQQLNRARDALEHGHGHSGRALATLLMSALVLVSDLYNRAEQAFLRGAEPPGAPPLDEAQLVETEVTGIPVEQAPAPELGPKE
jgi:hypothetical protein